MKKCLTLFSVLCLFFVGIYFTNYDEVYAQEDEPMSEEELRYSESLEAQLEREQMEAENEQWYDCNGNPISKQMPTIRKARSIANSETRAASDYDAKYGIVDFYINRPSNAYISYTNEETGASGYIGGYNAREAAYLGLTKDGRIRFKMAGVVGIITTGDMKNVAVYGDNKNLFTSFYRVENDGVFYHYHITVNHYTNAYRKQAVGYAADVPYLKKATNYYSYDGHYFYTDEHAMVDNYRANHYNNAVNANTPYYNYYQFLPLRSMSDYTAAQLDAYTAKKVAGAKSAMVGLGSEYLKQGNAYGVNPLMIYATSALESGWGKSDLSLIKNNLFGHAAYDSDAFNSATTYASPAECLANHAREFLSKRYLNPKNEVYFGGMLGDKGAGANVKYASDPWWGENQAAILMGFSEDLGKSDYKKYTIGIKGDLGGANVRNEPSTKTGKVLYTTISNRNLPFIILGKVKGEYTNGSDVWYKVQCDGNLNSSRTALDTESGAYNYSNSYAYIHSSNITTIIGEITDDGNDGEDIEKYLPGDANSDGKVNAVDYLMIKDYIMNKLDISKLNILNADVNDDKKVSAVDYLMIKDYIMGKIEL